MNVRPWQVWWVNLGPQVGRKQAGRRPAIVVGTELACQWLNDLAIVVPCTTRDRGFALHPSVDLAGTPSVAMCDQVKSVSTERLLKPHPAVLTAGEIEQLRFVLRRLISV